MSVVLFLVILAVLIFVHELGHFIVAKVSGIRVDEFAIGFPPRILRWKKGETLYTLNLIPIGGFVKIFGENPDEASLSGPHSNRSFAKKSRLIQALTLVAGVFFNIVFGWFLISGALALGLPQPIEPGSGESYSNPEVVVADILPHSPAETAGFLPGDSLVKVESGGIILSPITSDSVREFVNTRGGEKITVTVKRKGSDHTIGVTPVGNIVSGREVVGFSLADIGIVRLSLSEAFARGAITTYRSLVDITVGLFGFIKNVSLGTADLKQVTGPVGIVGLVGQASDFGLAYLLSFTAFISLNLAVINILPIPALDGGRLAVVLIEGIIRRPLNYRYVNTVNTIGFVLLIILMLVITYQDIFKLIHR